MLRAYAYRGEEHRFIPKNETIAGKRQIRVGCKAKAIGSDHTLVFVIKDVDKGYVPSSKSFKVRSNNEWMPFSQTFFVDPAKNWVVRIADQGVSRSPSSVQIRDLVVAERPRSQ